MAKVSVLMNGYNAQKYLKEAIDSIYAQSFQDWEIVFVDNCSTDRTKEIVDSYDDKIKYYKTKKNIPLGDARNFGLQYCNSEYIAFLDTDDIWLPSKLEEQIELLERNRELQMCYGGAIWIDEDGNEINKDLPKATTGYTFAYQLVRYEVNMQTVLVRNSIDISFNPYMEFSPDYDLFMKIMSEYPVGVISTPLVKYRKISNSLTSKKINRWSIEMKETLDSIFNTNSNLKREYAKEYSLAYAKVAYYRANYLVGVNEIKKARVTLAPYKFINSKYFILYLSLLFSVSFWNFIHRFK